MIKHIIILLIVLIPVCSTMAVDGAMKSMCHRVITTMSTGVMPAIKHHYMNQGTEKIEERKQVAKAILELHELYCSTGEEKKPMTISLPDLAEMAVLSQDVIENILTQFVEEKLIRIEKSAITILEKRKLKKIAS